MKNYETGVCANCGAPDGLHRFDTKQCPLNGVECHYTKPQLFQLTCFEDSGLVLLHDAAPYLAEAVERLLPYAKREYANFGAQFEKDMAFAEAALKKALEETSTNTQT